MIADRHGKQTGLSVHQHGVPVLLVSVDNVSDFQRHFGVPDLVLASIRLLYVVGSWVLSRPVFEQFLESLEVVRLHLFLHKDGHGELLGNDHFIGRNTRITCDNRST